VVGIISIAAVSLLGQRAIMIEKYFYDATQDYQLISVIEWSQFFLLYVQ